MELERRDVKTLTICSDSFLPLGKIQAKAMGIDLRFSIIPHPLGGVEEREVIQRHTMAAWPQIEVWMRDLSLSGGGAE